MEEDNGRLAAHWVAAGRTVRAGGTGCRVLADPPTALVVVVDVPATIATSAIGARILSTVSGENLFAEAFPFGVGIWVVVTIAAELLTVGLLLASPWWDQVRRSSPP